MTKIPMTDPTLAAIDAALEAQGNDETPRPYFGMSSAGDPCARKLWLRFRWAERETFAASTLKMFADGHAGEELQAKRLRLVKDLELHVVDPDTGRQFAVKACGGHSRGHLDGALVGLLQAPKTWHVWEHKQVNEKKFAQLQKLVDEKGEKQALEAWDETYFAQGQLYMHGTGMRRHYLTCSTPGGRATIGVRTEYQKDKAERLMQRCADIVFAAEPPLRISDDPTFWLCKRCAHADQCHGTAAPLVNCRTCAHATPRDNGTWTCDMLDCVLSIDAQRIGCKEHRFIPALIESFAEVSDVNDNDVTWRNKLTGALFAQPPYSSNEIRAAEDKRLLGEAGVDKFKAIFGGAALVNTKNEPPRRLNGDDFSDIPWLDEPPAPGSTPAEVPF